MRIFLELTGMDSWIYAIFVMYTNQVLLQPENRIAPEKYDDNPPQRGVIQ